MKYTEEEEEEHHDYVQELIDKEKRWLELHNIKKNKDK